MQGRPYLRAKSLQWCMNSASSSSVTYERPIFSMLACISPHIVIELKLSATCIWRVYMLENLGKMHRGLWQWNGARLTDMLGQPNLLQQQ